MITSMLFVGLHQTRVTGITAVHVTASTTNEASAAVVGGSVGGVIALLILIGVILLSVILVRISRYNAQSGKYIILCRA